jgi:hypothetical protein
MAYPDVGGPYGLLPINLIGGQVYAGATRQLPIASGYAKNIGFGDTVSIISTGYINRVDSSTGAASAFPIRPVGIFLGCSYTDPTLKYKVFKQYWPTGTVASDAVAIIADDPDILMKVAVVNNSAVVVSSSGLTLADIGINVGYFLKANTGVWVDGVNTATGNSTLAIDKNTLAVTNSLPFRIVDTVKETALADGTFCEAIVAFNAPYTAISQLGSPSFTVTASVAGGHQYRNPTGI